MSFSPKQLPLAIQLRDDATFSNFYEADNGLLMAQLRQQLSTDEHYIYLYGSEGAGCSHLLQAACNEASRLKLTSVYLPLKDLQTYQPRELFSALEQLDLICIDDIHLVMGDTVWEVELFHLFNRLRDSGVKLLIAANCAVRELAVDLSDLTSRLSWGSVYQIKTLTDEQRSKFLQFRARQRGMELSDDVAQYICLRSERSTGALVVVLDTLDVVSIQQQRRLTIPFVKEALNW